MSIYLKLFLPVLGFDKIPLWGTFIISFGVGTIVAILVRFAVVPWQRRKIKGKSCYKILFFDGKLKEL